jgi:hypothetical protein
MSEKIKLYSEWFRDPSYHGSYADYVLQMTVANQRANEDRLANKIADLVVEKLKKKSIADAM